MTCEPSRGYRKPKSVHPLVEEISGTVRAQIARQRRDQKDIAKALGLHPNVFGRKS